MENEKDFIKNEVGDMLEITNISLTRRKKTKEDIEKDLFVKTINDLMEAHQSHLNLLHMFNLSLFEINEKLWESTDNMIYMAFGKDIGDLITFYLYKSIDELGESVPYILPDGYQLYITNPEHLYYIWKNYASSQTTNKTTNSKGTRKK